MDWFHSLNKPFLAPPDSVFMPVWTILYIMIILSFIFFIKFPEQAPSVYRTIFFIIQMLLNLAWMPVFFGLKSILGALIIIIFMWIFLVLTIITFFRHSKLASFLLIPYLLWISFAFYLNLGYFVMN